MRNLRWRQAPGKSWLSFEEIRTRLEVGPGTPSLKRPAKTFAPGHIKYSQGITQGYAGGSRRNGTPPNLWSETRSEVRRGVTVVGELAERETERILTGNCNAAPGREWLGVKPVPDLRRGKPCLYGNVCEKCLVEMRLAASGSGESAYF